MKHHKDLNLCIHKAIDYDDNCGKGEDDTRSKTSDSSKRETSQIDEIVKEVMEKIQQMYVPPIMVGRYVGEPHYCRVCGGNHSRTQCLPMKS